MFGVRAVSVSFDGREALGDVSLDAKPGEVTTVVGGDGAGKSTLLRVLARRILPETGTVTAPSGSRIGLLPATSGSWAALTVTQNLEFAASAARLRNRKSRLTDLIGRAGLTPAKDRLAAQLSGGMRRKLGVIMAMVANPELLLLDEPTTGVDPVSRVELWGLVSQAAADGAAVVTATNYLDEAERADGVCVLHEGRVLLAGSPTALVDLAPGSFWTDDLPEGRFVWRRGRTSHHWDERLPPERRSSRPDLHDVVVAAALRSEENR